MEKFCRLLPWLDIGLAGEMLKSLTGEGIGAYRFMALCEATRTPAYLDCSEWAGEIPASACEEQTDAKRVIGAGICTIDHPGRAYEDEVFFVTGPAKIKETGRVIEVCQWRLDEYDESRPVIFKPTDIEALAAKMNGASERPSTPDVEVLRRQLEAVRAELAETKQKMSEPTPKSRNAYLRTIAALGHALIGGGTGKPNTDANAILAALDKKGIEPPIKSAALADYLTLAKDI